MKKINNKYAGHALRGFSLIEILVAMGIIAVLAGIVLVAVNPSRQFMLARDSQRRANVAAILSAVGQNIAEHHGVFICDEEPFEIPFVVTTIKKDGVDLARCVVPDYITSMPFDPSASGAHFVDLDEYNTEYSIVKDNDTGRITVSAPHAEIDGSNISLTR